MSADIIPFRRPTDDGADYFGGCPSCGRNNGYLNYHSDHWFVCREHRTRWLAGSNLFSDWREESEDDWRRNRAAIEDYADVEPVYPRRGAS